VTSNVNADTIRKLADAAPGDRPVVSLYLDVDGRRWPKYQDCEARAERLVRTAVERSAGANGHAGALDDLRRVESYVKGGIDRSTTRGIAAFSAGPTFWHVFELPIAVHDQLVVESSPHVHQLETVVATNERFAVLLVDRQRARLFVFEMGRLVDRTELFDALPRHDDDAGDRDRRHDKHKLEAAAAQHLKRAARAAFEMFQQQPFDHLVVGAAEDIATQLEADLHPWLRDRIAARLHIPVAASDADVRAAALAVEEQVERAKESALVARVRESAGAGSGGVVGLPGVLGALAGRRVDTLVVSAGYESAGWSCASCARLAEKGPACPGCSEPMERAGDVVERAIEETLRQGGHVKVCVANADLDVAGRVGALLRF
jgi:peptide chain release factor subunit 1